MLRRETDLIDNDIYIGSTLFQDPRVARLVPHALARPDGWRRVEPGRFPEEGTVFSVDPKVLRKPKGYVVLFTVARNDRPGGRDRFITSEVDEPYEIANELSDVTPEARRKAIMETGLDRRLQDEPRMLVPVGDDELAFPRLQRSGTDARWTLSHQEEADRIEIFAMPPGGLGRFVVEGRPFALPGRIPTRVVGHVNWQTDAEFLQYLLKKVRKTGGFTSASDDFKITDRMVVKLYGFYRDTSVIGERAGVNEAVRDRLGEFLSRLSGGSAALAEIADALHGHPEVKSALAQLSQQDLDALRDRETARVRPIVQGQIEAELGERYAERDALKAETEELAGRLAVRSEKLREIDGLADAGLATLRNGLGSYLGQIKEVGETVGRLVEVAGMQRPASSAPAEDRSFPWTSTGDPAAMPIAGSEIVTVAMERSKARGLPEDALRRLDILCRAGEIPVLTGDSVEVALACYAGLVAGGDLFRMPLDPTVLGSDDVWRHPGSGEPTTFAAAWRSAQSEPGKPVLVCLDDLDRASLSDWFPRFRSLYRANRPLNLFVAATLSGDGGEFQNFDDGKLMTRVPCDAGSAAFMAAVGNGGKDRPTPRRLVLEEPSRLSDAERITLLAKLSSSVGVGGDIGVRLLAVHAAARTWFDHDGASDFAARMVVAGTGDRHQSKTVQAGRVVVLSGTNERRGQS